MLMMAPVSFSVDKKCEAWSLDFLTSMQIIHSLEEAESEICQAQASSDSGLKEQRKLGRPPSPLGPILPGPWPVLEFLSLCLWSPQFPHLHNSLPFACECSIDFSLKGTRSQALDFSISFSTTFLN